MRLDNFLLLLGYAIRRDLDRRVRRDRNAQWPYAERLGTRLGIERGENQSHSSGGRESRD